MVATSRRPALAPTAAVPTYPCRPCPTSLSRRPRPSTRPSAGHRRAAPGCPGGRRAGTALRGSGARAGPRRRPGARRAARPARPRPGLHHRRPARRRCSRSSGLGRRALGGRHRLRHGRVPARATAMVEVTTYRAEAYDRESRKPEVAYGDSLEDDLVRRDFTVNAMAVALPEQDVRRPVRRAGRPRRAGAAHPGPAGGLLRRRPAADDAGGPVRRPARLRGATRGRRGDDGDGRPDRDRLGRAGPRRAGQAVLRARTRGRGCGCSSTPAWPTACCPSCPRCGWRSTSTTGTRTSTSTR